MKLYYFSIFICFLNFCTSSVAVTYRLIQFISALLRSFFKRTFRLVSVMLRRGFFLIFSFQFVYFPVLAFFLLLRLSLLIVSSFHNAFISLLLFLSSWFMLFLDFLYFIFGSPLQFLLSWIQNFYFRSLFFVPFTLAQFLVFFFKYFFTILVFFFVFLLIFINPLLFSSYVIENRSDEFLDMLSHGVVGAWYSSNWWYFRIWIFYVGLYVLFPNVRLYISENVYFIFYFPLILKIIDITFDYFSLFESTAVSIGGGISFMQTYFFYELLLPFFFQYGEGLRTNSSFEYSTNGFDGQELGEWYDDWDFAFEEVAANYSFFDPSNPETYFTYGRSTLFNLDLIHQGTVRRNRQSTLMRRYLMLPYGMDVGELTFKSNDIADLPPVLDIYYDEFYYLRALESADQSPLIVNLSKYYF